VLNSCYPNPFNSSTTISFTLPRSGWTSMEVMDVNGRLVKRLSGGWKEAGSYREVWDGKGVESGTYLIRLDNQGQSSVRETTLLK